MVVKNVSFSVPVSGKSSGETGNDVTRGSLPTSCHPQGQSNKKKIYDLRMAI